jgi:hypothetical protein
MNTQHPPAVTAGGRPTRVEGERLLRLSLGLDAVVTGANGVAYLVAADALFARRDVTA